MALVPAVWLAFWSFAQVFVICDACQRVTSHYEIDIYSEWDWYTFSKNVRFDLPMVIIGSQLPVEVKGLGNIVCTREMFKKVSG